MDIINHPEHYTGSKIECLDAIEAALGSYNFQSYLRGQILKYIWRMDKKGSYFEDSKKAQFYLNRLVERIQADLDQPEQS